MCYLLGSWTSSVQELYFIFFPPCSFVSEELVSLLRSSLPVPRDGWRYVWLARILSTCKTGEQAFFPRHPHLHLVLSRACLEGNQCRTHTYLQYHGTHSFSLNLSFGFSIFTDCWRTRFKWLGVKFINTDARLMKWCNRSLWRTVYIFYILRFRNTYGPGLEWNGKASWSCTTKYDVFITKITVFWLFIIASILEISSWILNCFEKLESGLMEEGER